MTTFVQQAPVRVTVNGQLREVEVSPRVTVLDWVREDLGLTGAKKGCNEGACGACTVLVDGVAMNGCLVLVVQCDRREVTTVEGLAAADGTLSDLQASFVEHDAFQCGYCTPGQLVSATACVAAGEATNVESIREWMSGNICRCSAYPQINEAIVAVGAR